MDANYAYISTEMPGYIGNILVTYDIRNPAKPEEVSKWWMTGQHIAGGEKPTWSGRQHRLHHTLRFGNELWAGCWHGGVRVIDVTDIRKPKTTGAYNYHPPYPEPSHTFMPVLQMLDGSNASRSPSTKKITPTTPRKWRAAAAGRTAACGCSM